MARKVDKTANFVFVQLIEQDPGIYDTSHPDYARREKIDLASEKISHEINESGMCLYIYIITKTYNRIKTTTILWQDQYHLTLQKRSSRNWRENTPT
jgi:hypothetical protein